MNTGHTCHEGGDAILSCVPCALQSLQMLTLRLGNTVVRLDDTYEELRDAATDNDRCVCDESQQVADTFTGVLAMLHLLVARLADFAELDPIAPLLLRDESVLTLEATIAALQRAYRIDLSNMDSAPSLKGPSA